MFGRGLRVSKTHDPRVGPSPDRVRDATGKLWDYVRCGFGLKTVPSAFANYGGGQLIPVKMKGVRNWLDDIIIPTATAKDQFVLLREAFDLIRAGHLSVNLPKSEFCFPVV